MLPTDLKIAVRHLIEQKRPGFLRGQPGIGKSEIMSQVAANMGIGFIDMRLSLYDPTDLKGFPSPDAKAGVVNWLPLGTMPRKGEGVLFLDELPNAVQAVQSAALQLILDRGIGDYRLPDGWAIMAAGNREGDRAGVSRMLTSLISRFVFIDVETSVKDFTAHAIDRGIKPEVIAFLRLKENALNTYDPATASQPYACPRTWFFVSENIMGHGLPPMVERQLMAGTIGEGVTTEFIAFMKTVNDLPDMAEIMKSPKTAKLPVSMAGKYTVCTTLAMNATEKNFATMLTYIERLDKEFQCMFVRDAGRRDKTTSNTEAFTKWLQKNQTLLMN